MSDAEPPTRPASPVRKTATRAARAGVGVVWLVPLLALLVTIGVAWNSYVNRGSIIEVEFADATGIVPGETTLRFREVTVGQVESVRFTSDLSNVVVSISVDREVAQFIDDEARFWIVRPQVTAQGVTRLDTVLSGAFIEGYWDSDVSKNQNAFKGLERPPLVREDARGTWVTLNMDDADGITEGAPILYRGLEVGQMQNLHLSEEDDTVIVDAFIEAPHDQRVTTSTVFWDTSGFSLSLDTRGVSFNVNSLASVLQGGVSFDTIVSGGQPIEPGHTFVVQADEETARQNIFTEDRAGQLKLDVLVDNAVSGLEKGADVQFLGLRVGQVTDLSVWVPENTGNEPTDILQKVSISISPRRLGLPDGATPEDALEFLSSSVEAGLRARVASAGFFGSSLIVELVNIPDAPEAKVATDAEPNPIIPAVEGDISDFTDTAEGLLSRVGDLPLEEVLRSATDMMNSVTTLMSSQETRAIPGKVSTLVDSLDSAAGKVDTLAGEIQESGAGTKLATMIDEANEAFDAVKLAAEDVPEMVDEMDAVAVKLNEVDFAGLSAQAEGILTDLRAMLGSEDAEELPRNLSDTLEAASGLLNDLRDGNAAGSLNNALESASSAAEEVEKSVQELPQLIRRLEATAARADAVLAAYGDRSAFNSEAVNMLRELRRATESFGSLARMIERNPRAFILGR